MSAIGLVVALGALSSATPGNGPSASSEAAECVHPLVWRLLEGPQGCVAAWVFFADRGDDPGGPAGALAPLSPRAIERRALRRCRSGLVDEQDLPPHAGYVAEVCATGADLRVESRWLNAVSVTATCEHIRALALLPFVQSIQPVRRGRRAEAVPIVAAGRAAPGAGAGFYGLAQEQLEQIGVTSMHAAGYSGAGIVIGVLDTGFVLTHEAYTEPGHELSVIAQWDFIDGDPDPGIEPGDPPNQHRHGTIVLGTIGGYRPGTLVGGAYDASFVLAKTEDTAGEYPLEEDYYVAGLEFIEAAGADVATSSLGYSDWYDWYDMDGLTAVTTIGVNTATANGLVCCTAAGNGGYDSDLPTLVAPGDAFDVLTCGAADSSGQVADFSSDGPTADGRVKPEVLARGVATHSVDPDDDTGYLTASGTSLSTPLVASAAALLVQAHPDWTVAQIRWALFGTADYYAANGEPDPEYRRGYGVIDVFAASAVTFCGADLDGDGSVGITDLLDLLASWGPCRGCPADLDVDGTVGITDLLDLLAAWGPCA
jgi:hypothetical protein